MRLRDEARIRSLLPARENEASFSRLGFINWLQIDDALNGIVPRPSPDNATPYHSMYATQLQKLADERGFRGWASRRRQEILAVREAQRAEQIDPALRDQDAGHANAAAEPARDDEEDDITTGGRAAATYIRYLMMRDIEEGFNFFQPLRPGDEAPDARSRTSNHGIEGNLDALRSLHQTLLNERYPQTTSGAGLLCGPRALADSINTFLLDNRRDYPAADYPRVTHEGLMMVMMPSFDPTDEQQQDYWITTDHITQEYQNWLRNSHMPDQQEGVIHDDQFADLTRVNNIDFQQMIGILETAHEMGILPRFGLGIVQSKFLDMLDGNL